MHKRDHNEGRGKAAQYVRMSSEHQQYSIENQKAAIRDYAQRHGLEIVRTYADEARSGLTVRKRSGLRRLLNDVLSGEGPFDTILVYDISRWGRFPDADEAACYEFLCRRFGLSVQYCAETFPNDLSISSSIMKNLKRVMASEFSRELGIKQYEARERLAREGYWAAGRIAFGLRRRLFSSDGKRIRDLGPGEHKNNRNDRVQLVPGEPEEVECVRRIYQMAWKGLGCSAISRELMSSGATYRGRPWNLGTLKNILTNPGYAGEQVWGKRSQRLGGPVIFTPEERWIRSEIPFASVIDKATFARVQNLLKRKEILRRWTTDRILRRLRALMARKRRLSQKLIDKTPGMPAFSTIRRHFGSNKRAYDSIGYKPTQRCLSMVESKRNAIKMREQVVAQLQAMFPGHVTVVRKNLLERPRVCVDGKAYISILLCRSIRTPKGTRWQMLPFSTAEPVLLCKLAATNKAFDSFCLLPQLNLGRFHQLQEQDQLLVNGEQLSDLSGFYECASKFLISARTQRHPLGN